MTTITCNRKFWFFILTLFQAGRGHYGPDDPKHSGVSAGIGLDLPKFLTLFLFIPDRSQTSHFRIFFWKFQKFEPQIFSGSSSIRWKIKKSQKNLFFLWEILLFLAESLLYMFSAFFWGILHICSSKFEISTFFGLKNLIFDLRHLTAHSRKNIPHRGLFLVSMESQRSKYLSETKFRLVGGLLAHIWRLKSIRAIMAPPW